MMNFYNPNTMPMPSCGCGCNAPTVCSNVVQECYVEEVPHMVNYHTHVVKNCVKKHITIPSYTQSEEVVYYDQYEPCCGYTPYYQQMPTAQAMPAAQTMPVEPNMPTMNSTTMPNNLFNQVNPFNF